LTFCFSMFFNCPPSCPVSSSLIVSLLLPNSSHSQRKIEVSNICTFKLIFNYV
jgi:hypothetical protein